MCQTMHEKNAQNMLAEKMLNEHREVLASLQETQVTMMKEIYFIKMIYL